MSVCLSPEGSSEFLSLLWLSYFLSVPHASCPAGATHNRHYESYFGTVDTDIYCNGLFLQLIILKIKPNVVYTTKGRKKVMIKITIHVQLHQPHRSSMTEQSEYVLKLDLKTAYLQCYSLPMRLLDLFPT